MIKKTGIPKVSWLFVLSAISIQVNSQPSANYFSVNGWQLHEWDIPKTVEAISQAPRYGVNMLIFSHDIFRSVEMFLASDPKRDTSLPLDYVSTVKPGQWSEFRSLPRKNYWKDFAQLTGAAKKADIPYYLWVHEFDDIPDRFLVGQSKVLDFDNPGLFPYIEKRYERLFKAMPEMKGIVLTFHESHYKLFRENQVASKLSVADRIYKTTMLLYKVAKKYKKDLIVRNFFYEPIEMQWFKEAIERLPADIGYMSKDATHEFHPFYPFDPLHGELGNRRHLIEFDASVEKALGDKGAYAQTSYIQKVIRRAYDKRMTGCVARVRMKEEWEKPFEDIHEVNWYAFARYMQNPFLSVDSVLSDWAKKHYPQEAAPFIVSALKRTEFIHHNSAYFLEFWSARPLEKLNNYSYAYQTIHKRSTYKWTGDPAHLNLETQLYNPSEFTFSQLTEEKQQTVAAADSSYMDIQKAKPFLNGHQALQLEEDFRFLVDATRVQQAWTEGFWSQMMYVNNPTDTNRERAEQAILKIEQIDTLTGYTYGYDARTGSRYGLKQIAAKFRQRINDIAEAKAEDKRLLSKTDAAVE